MKAGSFRRVVFVLNISDSGKAHVNVYDIRNVKPLSKIYAFAKWRFRKCNSFSRLVRSAIPDMSQLHVVAYLDFFSHIFVQRSPGIL